MGEDDHDVTLAVLAVEIREMRNEMRKGFVDVSARLSDHESRIRQNEKSVTKSTGFLGGFSLIASAVAAWIGSKF